MKFGFERKKENNASVVSEFILGDIILIWFKNDEMRFIGCPIFYLTRDKGIEIKHVHQLQNLFFALTGGELKMKE